MRAFPTNCVVERGIEGLWTNKMGKKSFQVSALKKDENGIKESWFA